uniref:sigma-70 family RNA polymerase sigma factor n=1 Tax=Nocardia miyunensis TaxID=282684 RepID=UPI000837930F
LGEVDRQYGRVMHRVANRLLHDSSRADDIVQEALIRLWRKPIMLDQPALSLWPWLHTVTRNLAYDELRSARQRHEFPTDNDTALNRHIDDPCTRVVDAWIMQRALATLSYQQREIIVHAYYRRATTREIATDLAIPPGTVKSRLHYAMRALRDAYTTDCSLP